MTGIGIFNKSATDSCWNGGIRLKGAVERDTDIPKNLAQEIKSDYLVSYA